MQTGLLLFTVCTTSEQFVFVRVIQRRLFNLQVKLSVVHRSHSLPSVPSIHIIRHPPLFHFGLKAFLCVNPCYRSLPFQDRLHGFPGQFTDTFEYIRFFYFLAFLFYRTSLRFAVGSGS